MEILQARPVPAVVRVGSRSGRSVGPGVSGIPGIVTGRDARAVYRVRFIVLETGTSSHQSRILTATIPVCGMRCRLAFVSETGKRQMCRPVSSSSAARAALGEPPSYCMAARVARDVLTRCAVLDLVAVILRASTLALS